MASGATSTVVLVTCEGERADPRIRTRARLDGNADLNTEIIKAFWAGKAGWHIPLKKGVVLLKSITVTRVIEAPDANL
jgi:hypothetical protein